MPVVSSVQMQIYNVAMIGSLLFFMLVALFPQSIKIALAMKNKKAFIIMAKNNGEIELVEADHKNNLWEAASDKKGESLGVFESKPEDVRRFFNRPTMLAYEAITPAANMKACVLIRHLKTQYKITTWNEYENLRDGVLAIRAALKQEVEEKQLEDYRTADVYAKLSEVDKVTFEHFNSLYDNGYIPDVVEPIRLQDMEKFLKYYHDPKSYVVRERNAVSVARAQAMLPKEVNFTKWILIGGICLAAFLLFGGSGDASTASSSAYAVSNPLSSFLGQ